MGDLSEHFSRWEFVCKGKRTKGHRQHELVVDGALLALLELVRAKSGRPVEILSGHRCALHNARVGGAGGSMHLAGKAVDVPAGLIYPFDAAVIGFTGIGIRGQWATHLDTRPGPVRTWRY